MSTTFDSHTAKFLSVVAQNMPRDMSGDVMQGWIDNPKALQKALRSALCPPTEAGQTEPPSTPELKVWKTVKLGTGLKTGDDFRKVFTDQNFHLSAWASDILGKEAFTVAPEATEVDLVVVSAKDLGFNRATRYDKICARANELGLELCSSEVGPQLRLQYLDQPNDEWLTIAMEAIRDSSGHLHVFRVTHGADGLWLVAGCGNPGGSWNLGARFVFRLRKPACPAGRKPSAT